MGERLHTDVKYSLVNIQFSTAGLNNFYSAALMGGGVIGKKRGRMYSSIDCIIYALSIDPPTTLWSSARIKFWHLESLV